MITAGEIYALRKARKAIDALDTIEQQINENSTSDLKIALGWVYYDLAKAAYEDQNHKAVQNHYAAFLELNIDPKEELINSQFARFAHFNEPWGLQYELAESQSRQGLHAEAIQLCRGIANNCDAFSSNALYGWILWRFMQEQTTLEKPNTKGINEVLDLYLELEMPRPSRLHSTMLRQVIKLLRKADFYAYKFMFHWGWENFRPEDLERYTDEKGLHYSLMEKAMHSYAQLLALTLSKYRHRKDSFEQLLADAQKFAPMLDGVIAEFSDNPYLQKERDKLEVFLGGV
jgi:hypothetical protein